MGRAVKYTAKKSVTPRGSSMIPGNPASTPRSSISTPFIPPDLRASLPIARQNSPESRRNGYQASPINSQSRSTVSDEQIQERSIPRRSTQEQQPQITPVARRNGTITRPPQPVVITTPRASESRSSVSQSNNLSDNRHRGDNFIYDNEEIYNSQSENYICVRDTKYSARAPVDRETLTKTFTELADDIAKRLTMDLLKHKRHAKRLYISCRNVSCRDTHPQLNEFLFLIQLPKEDPPILSWNKATASDIEIQIIKRAVSVPKSFVWQKIEAYLDCFISEVALERAIQSFETVPRGRLSGQPTRRTSPRKKEHAKDDDDDDVPEFIGVVVKKKR